MACTLKVWDIAPNEGDDVVPTEQALKAIVHCLRKFYSLVEWYESVTVCTTYLGLDSLVKGKHLAAQMLYLYTEVTSYLFIFK